MDQAAILAHLVAQFAHAAESLDGEDLSARECELKAALQQHGLDQAVLIEPQCDEILAQALRKGFFFRGVYNAIVARYEPQFRSWLMYWGMDYHEAFDLTQELLMSIFKKRLRSYLASKGSLASYLRRAAYNIRVTQKRRAGPSFKPLPEETLTARGVSSPEEMAYQEMEQGIQQALAELPPDQRAVLALRMDGLSHSEISERLNISAAASQMRLFHTRKTLRERLGLTPPPTNRGRPSGSGRQQPASDLEKRNQS